MDEEDIKLITAILDGIIHGSHVDILFHDAKEILRCRYCNGHSSYGIHRDFDHEDHCPVILNERLQARREEKNENQEEINIGDTVVIVDEFENKVEGTVITIDTFDTKGRYGVDIGDIGIYSRSKDEIEKKKS